MKSILITGPDSTLRDTYTLALQAYPDRRVEMLHIPSENYYHFDFTELGRFSPDDWDICAAVNEFYVNDVRRAFHQHIEKRGYKSTSVISPHAEIDSSATIGENVIIYSGCVVGAEAVIGHHTTLRPNVVLSEDVSVGDYATLEANVSIREGAKIGNFTTICANSNLMRMTQIGNHCYLNLSQQYLGVIPDGTFYSHMFENPIYILPNY